MFKTRITELLKIKYPIMQGGMRHLGTPELAAVVSNAGGLGTINASNYSTSAELKAAIKRVKLLTTKPFCVNISIVPTISSSALIPEYFQVIAEERVMAVETAGGSPAQYVSLLKSAGVKLICKVAAVKYAQKAEQIGADIVTIVGMECAGRPGLDGIGTIILGNKTSTAVKIPVFIAGGIADGKGLIAALALGGDGIVMGSRFVATAECIIHQKFKEWMVAANENDTIIIQRSIQNMIRAMKNQTALKSLEMEKQGASIQELLALNAPDRVKKCMADGDLESGIFAVGQAIGLINEIKTIPEVINDIIEEATTVMKRLNKADSDFA